MEQTIQTIKEEALKAISQAQNLEEATELRVKYLGRKSELNLLLRGVKDLPEDQRKKVGELANVVKREITDLLDKTERHIRESSFDFKKERIDVTIPGKKIERGALHPLTKVQNEIEDIFTSLGFTVADGPEVETEWYSFDALNIPEDHPARDKWDTFWIKGKADGKRILLRPHTSPVQVRFMQTHTPPFRVIVPGKCFRCEATDARHEHTFYQFEALMVGEDINVGNFKYIAQQFFSRFFKSNIEVRLRPSFFPFTEPSFEFDVSCSVCEGKGCSVCSQTGWLEIGGAGMVNQNVFTQAGYPRNKYQGFAWGFGLERLLLMRHKIDDIRLFHSGDLRFIKQF